MREKHLMKAVVRATLTLIVTLFLSLMVNVSSAQWDAINSGYAVTTDYHGKIVPLGTLVTAIAGTTDPNVASITFLWKHPSSETVAYEINVPVWSNGSEYNGKTIYYANSSYTPNVIGDWGVQALFIGEGGKVKANHADVIKIRATSFNVVPDLPVIGTAGAAATMILGFGVFLYRKKRQQ
jgi:hypothetical protein